MKDIFIGGWVEYVILEYFEEVVFGIKLLEK